MKSFLLASGNAHKEEEFKILFEGVMSVSAAPKTIDVAETGLTFTENAFLKAKAYYDTYKLPTLADDSGLVLNALPDVLGVQSARFAPDLPSYTDKCQKVLKLYLDKNIKDRNAYFVCILCFYSGPSEYYFFEGRLHGNIGTEIKGSAGFGYDPIFIPERKESDGLSLAELPEWKNEFSHRARAVQSALAFFKESVDKSKQKS